MAHENRIVELSNIIAKNTALVDEHLRDHNLPTPSFSHDGPASLSIPPNEKEVYKAQQTVIASTQELHNLMKGPTEMIMGIAAINPNDVLGLQTVYRYKLYEHIQPGHDTTYEELSAASGVNTTDLRRLLRHAMTNHIFEERGEDRVAHTAASRVLGENKMLRDIVGILTEEMFPGASRTLDALDRFDGAHSPNQTGFSIGHGTDKGLYEEFSVHPERGRRFAGAMSGFAGRTNADPIAAGFNWAAVKKVVDVGGGWGPVSISLADKFPDVNFEVQDLAHVIEDGPDHIPKHLKERVTFAIGDAFQNQEITDADVYLFRHVLHNFPDDSCAEILRSQIPALKQGACILVYDGVVPEHRKPMPAYQEKFRRSMDLIMQTFFGARERTLKEWQTIVQRADPRLTIELDSAMPDASNNLLKIILQNDAT